MDTKNREELEAMNVKTLKVMAVGIGVSGSENMNKATLVNALLDDDGLDGDQKPPTSPTQGDPKTKSAPINSDTQSPCRWYVNPGGKSVYLPDDYTMQIANEVFSVLELAEAYEEGDHAKQLDKSFGWRFATDDETPEDSPYGKAPDEDEGDDEDA